MGLDYFASKWNMDIRCKATSLLIWGNTMDILGIHEHA